MRIDGIAKTLNFVVCAKMCRNSSHHVNGLVGFVHIHWEQASVKTHV